MHDLFYGFNISIDSKSIYKEFRDLFAPYLLNNYID